MGIALGAALLLLALLHVPGVGHTVNGATRWVRLGPVTFQPSEIAKWLMIPVLAAWCAARGRAMRCFFRGFLPAFGGLVLLCALIVVEDLGTAALLAAVGVGLLVMGGARWTHVAMVGAPGVAALAAAVWHRPYRMERIRAFLEPWADPQGAGYQPLQSMLAIADGGMTGSGLGHGMQKLGYLPADTSDFLFAVICEELGLFGALLVMALQLTMIWTLLGMASHRRDVFGRLLAVGVAAMFGVQTLFNLGVVTALLPTKGIALPLVSAGGTGWVMTALAVGWVLADDRFRERHEPLVGRETASP
jgi:cell division protein FtsW